MILPLWLFCLIVPVHWLAPSQPFFPPSQPLPPFPKLLLRVIVPDFPLDIPDFFGGPVPTRSCQAKDGPDAPDQLTLKFYLGP